MRTRDVHATTAGVLFIAATATSLIATALLGSLLDGPGVLAFCAGATLYYLIFYRSRLIPRWLSVWGLAGTVLCLTAGLLVFFQSIAVLSSTQVALSLPIAVQEMVLAVWLIVKGFSPKPGSAPPLSRQQSQAFAEHGSTGS